MLLQSVDRRLVALEVLLEQVVVLFDRGLDELLAPLLDDVSHVVGHVGDLVRLGVVRTLPDPRLAGQEIDDARKLSSMPIGRTMTSGFAASTSSICLTTR